MRRNILFSVLLCFVNLHSLVAQTTLPDFGAYSTEELSMTECSMDKDAEAVILLDEANSHYDDDYQLITERRIRIKILNQRGIDRGSIKIPFYSKDGFEVIRKVEAMSFTPGDKDFSKVSRKSIFTEKEDDRYSNIKFAIPNVKPGSIIEYRYTSVMKNYGGLDKWFFQSDIPTLKSCYRLEVLPNCDFSYVVTKKIYYDILIVPPHDDGIVYFEMNNLPGLRFEPYMDAVKDYLQKIEFKFSGCLNEVGILKEVNATWNSVANDLLTDEILGGVLKTKMQVPGDLTTRVSGETNDLGRATVIYKYVKNNFTWNGYYSKYAPDGLKKVWDSRTGTTGEINLLLINLLQSFKLTASPLLVADRDFGKIDPVHVYIDRFNKTVAYVTVDGKNLILDATEKYCPATLTPYSLLNTLALLIDKKTDKLLEIASTNETYKNNIKIASSLDKDGLFRGSCVMSSADYAKESNIARILADKKRFVTNEYEASYPGLKVDSFSYNYTDGDSNPLVQHFNFVDQLDESGGFILFNYNLFTGLTRNPFTADRRFTNINFGYPFRIDIEEVIDLPVNSKTDDLLKDKTLETGSKDIFLSREIRRTGNTIIIKIIFRQTITLIAADSYQMLKNFYRSMIEMLNEPLVIKLGK